MESVCRLIAKEIRNRVPSIGVERNYSAARCGVYNIQTAANPNRDERVNNLRACFADVMMERAKVFQTPFPEFEEVADEIGVKLGF